MVQILPQSFLEKLPFGIAIQLSLSSQRFSRALEQLLSHVKMGVNFRLGQGVPSISFSLPSLFIPLSGSQQMNFEPTTRSAQVPSARTVRVQTGFVFFGFGAGGSGVPFATSCSEIWSASSSAALPFTSSSSLSRCKSELLPNCCCST